MRIPVLLLAYLALALACAAPGGKDGEDDPDRPEADADTDADTDADADTDTDTDVDLSPCGVYTSAALVGSEAVHRYTNEEELGYGGTYTNVTESYDAGTGEVVFSSETTLDGASYRYYEGSSTSVMRCDDDGLWMESYYAEYAYETTSGYAGSGWTEAVYEDGYLVMPSSPAVGDRWTASGTLTYDGSAGPGSLEYAMAYEVVGAESRTVPAGTFSTLRIAQTTSGDTTELWVAPDIGTIETEYAELTRWTP
ncbi:MAG: hypothetical protein Q8P41_28250 [Pseudomonadota bacterium]|nr:hypothetical protein [Pseudomonadota bacterium]